MKKLTRTQGQRLVELAHLLRPEWDIPGIESAVRKAAEHASAVDVAIATMRVVANDEAETPGLIPKPGAHWQGTKSGSNMPPTMCGLHPDHPALRCPVCEREVKPATPEQIAEARALARRLARQEQDA